MESVKKYARIILNIVIPLAEILLVCLLGPKLLRFFMPFVIGWVIAMIANPLVRFLESRVRIVRKHSSVMIVVVVLAAIIGLGYFLISRLFWQAFELAKDLPELYDRAAVEIQAIFLRFDDVFRMLPANIQQAWQQFAGNVGQTISVLVQKIASPTVEVAGSVAKGIPNALVNVVVTILSSYFFIAERDKIIEFWKRYIPQNGGRYYRNLKGDVKRLIGGYFLAQFKIMFVVAAILMAGFLVLGIDYAFLLAILVAILDFLPLFGTGTVLIPWAVVKLLSADYALAAGLALLYVLTQVVRQVIQPKIVGDSMGLPPLMTLVFLYLGFKLHGISGMILAVPLGILVLNLYKYGAFDSMLDSMKLLVSDVRKFRLGDNSHQQKDTQGPDE
ncbi:sporulation integral membrane protein YtvI [Clostridium sp. AN503]|uniref:sporulation integral membrane protein YtvI n=1 Tax=Clostridium sp. AN503 TaxID=3160598 RepID=UPI00345B36C2